MYLKTKSQVSFFIIIGILILVSLIIVALITIKKNVPDADVGVNTPEYTEIRTFVENCVRDSTDEALEIFRVQGGFIQIPYNYQTLKLEQSSGISYEQGIKQVERTKSEDNTAFWITKDQINFPSTSLIKQQFTDYITERTKLCVNDFAEFRNQGFAIKYEQPTIEVDIENNLEVRADFKIDAKKGSREVKINAFKYTKNINIRKLHETILKIVSYEDLFSFLESDTKRLISLYSGVNENKLPPFTATIPNMDCSYVTWDEEKAKEHLKEILAKNIPLIRINNTQPNRVYGESQQQQQFLESFSHDIGLDRKDIKVSFSYDTAHNLSLDIFPNKGPGIQPPDRVKTNNVPLLSQFCAFTYRYKYDVEYPVVITITDYSSDKPFTDEKGFEIKIPVMVYICGNNERYCSNPAEFSANAYQIDKNILELANINQEFCAESNKKTKTKISVTDSSGILLEGADVNYMCAGENNNCYIGKTAKNGILETNFPQCSNGILFVSKYGYGKSQKIATIKDSSQEFGFSLEKEQQVEAEVKVIKAIDLISSYIKNQPAQQSSQQLSGREDVILTGKGATMFVHNIPSERKTISLASGEYSLDVLMNSQLKILPSYISSGNRTMEMSYNPLGKGTYEGSWPVAKYSAKFTVPKKQISKITFYALTQFRPFDSITAGQVSDDVFDENGDISAELLFRQAKTEEGCTGDYSLIAIDGTGAKDFAAGECEKVEYAAIKKEQYEQMLEPTII